MMALAVLVQLFAALSPPQSTLAKSDNDLIYGGFTDKSQAVLHCLNPALDFNKILNYYGINCLNVDKAEVVQSLDPHARGNQLFSMGRLPYGKAGEQPINIPGANHNSPLYIRYLWSWGGKPYKALHGRSDAGLEFYILFDCGNLTFVGIPPKQTAPTPKPAPAAPPTLNIFKHTLPGYPTAGSTVTPGSKLGFRLSYSNTGGTGGFITVVTDGLPAHTTLNAKTNGNADTVTLKSKTGDAYYGNNPYLEWYYKSLNPGVSTSADVELIVDKNTPDNTQICNQARIVAYNAPTQKFSDKLCFTVKRTAVPAPSTASCSSLTATPLGNLSYNFLATTVGGDYVVTGYHFDFGDGSTQNLKSDLYIAKASHTYAQAGTYTIKATATAKVTNAPNSYVLKSLACQTSVTATTAPPPVVPPTTTEKSCEAMQSSDNLEACLVPHKTALNVSRNSNANGQLAHAGETIKYTITNKNIGKVTVPGFVVRESVSDILDYADITDLHGGTMDKYKIVTWPAANVSAGQTLTQFLTVKIKNPIPNTPISASDPGHFDHQMTNVYGDTIVVKLPGNVVTLTQHVNQQLVNTGPGASVIALVGLTVIVGYFFARSRLMREEIDIVRSDYAATGGL